MSDHRIMDQASRPPRLQADPDLEYIYYDAFNVFVGPEEVVLELGNRQRSQPEAGIVHQRVVLSPGTARRLAQTLTQGLQAMEEQVRTALAEASRGNPN
ncbi:MAG: DUF3467 domain-containing protein [Desulfovibrio sp.]